MSIHQTKHKGNYTIIPNAILEDKALSLKARGLLVFMLSRPPKWRFSIRGLVSATGQGERVIESALKELQKAGYVSIKKCFPDASHKRIEYEYEVFDARQGVQNVPLDKGGQGVQNQGVQNVPLDKGYKTYPYNNNVTLINTNKQIKRQEKKPMDERPLMTESEVEKEFDQMIRDVMNRPRANSISAASRAEIKEVLP